VLAHRNRCHPTIRAWGAEGDADSDPLEDAETHPMRLMAVDRLPSGSIIHFCIGRWRREMRS
jgi:hypothetical protein